MFLTVTSLIRWRKCCSRLLFASFIYNHKW